MLNGLSPQGTPYSLTFNNACASGLVELLTISQPALVSWDCVPQTPDTGGLSENCILGTPMPGDQQRGHPQTPVVTTATEMWVGGVPQQLITNIYL